MADEQEAMGEIGWVCGGCGDTHYAEVHVFGTRADGVYLPDGWTCRRPLRGALIGDAFLCPTCVQKPRRK